MMEMYIIHPFPLNKVIFLSLSYIYTGFFFLLHTNLSGCLLILSDIDLEILPIFSTFKIIPWLFVCINPHVNIKTITFSLQIKICSRILRKTIVH